MKYSRLIFGVAAAFVCVNMFALRQSPQDPSGPPAAPPTGGPQPEQERTIIDIKGRRMFPIDVGDSTAISLVGQVIAFHNGSVITCDSAVRYSDRKIECFGNVLINKDSTYVYGDRADYDGDRNIARVYSPLIKMVDGDAVLYTYNFKFNTLDNIGEYYGGGTIRRGETLIESDKGFYYGDSKDFICVGNAELRDSAYQIMSDSLGYNMDTEIATFYSKTHIWNEKGEILSANKGWYYTADEHYHFTSDAYILTEEREIWADDINYWSLVEDAVLRSNIQIRDEEQKVLAFGDYGLYFGVSGNAMLTENPSLASFYEEGDTLYMRSDSIFMYVLDSTSIYSSDYVGNKNLQGTGTPDEELLLGGEGALADAIRGKQLEMTGMMKEAGVSDSTLVMPADSLGMPGGGGQDTLTENEAGVGEGMRLTESQQAPDSTSILRTEPTKKELREQQKAQKQQIKAEKRRLKEEKRQQSEARRKQNKRDKKGVEDPGGDLPDQDAPSDADGTGSNDGEVTDAQPATTAEQTEDDGGQDPGEEEDAEKERVVVGYHDVKIWRTDFQAVCDSILAFSVDTTVHMHIDPVLWNGENQITSEQVVVYIVDEELDKAVFSGGTPIMSSRIDQWHYNQVTGKVIEAYFTENELYRTDANGNGQTYYYLQDEETGDFQGFLVVECSDITFHIAERTVDNIVFRGNPVYAIYPMDMIPADQDQTFPGFEWQGARRPEKTDVFDRTIVPSRREEYSEKSPPEFPLTEKINDRKSSLINSGSWRDRNEDISQAARDWISTIR